MLEEFVIKTRADKDLWGDRLDSAALEHYRRFVLWTMVSLIVALASIFGALPFSIPRPGPIAWTIFLPGAVLAFSCAIVAGVHYRGVRTSAARYHRLTKEESRQLNTWTPTAFDASLAEIRDGRGTDGGDTRGWRDVLSPEAFRYRRRYLIWQALAYSVSAACILLAIIVGIAVNVSPAWKWLPVGVGVGFFIVSITLSIRSYAKAVRIAAADLGLPREHTRELNLRYLDRYLPVYRSNHKIDPPRLSQ